MIKICEQFAESHSITFNPSITKLLCFNMKLETKIPPIYLNGERVSIVEHEKHLRNYLSTDIADRNVDMLMSLKWHGEKSSDEYVDYT